MFVPIVTYDNISISQKMPAAGGLTFIEQLHAIALQSCIKENRPYITGISESDALAILTRPACKMWNCATCAARNARRWIARIIHGVNRMDTVDGWRMFTLTAHEKMRGRSSSVLNLREGWKKLYNRLRREFGTNNYARVWESHADGSFHLHGLVDCNIPKRWLRNNARQCGMGYQVDISLIENAGQVAGYISKYFLKSEVIGQYPKGLRRIEVSRNWLKLPELHAETLLTWLVNQTREGQLRQAQYYYDHGYEIIDTLRVSEG